MEEQLQSADDSGTQPKPPLCELVRQAVDAYLTEMNGYDTDGLHQLVIQEVEKPLLQAVLDHVGHNQTKAAKVLGLSRSTLRKKMEHYHLT